MLTFGWRQQKMKHKNGLNHKENVLSPAATSSMGRAAAAEPASRRLGAGVTTRPRAALPGADSPRTPWPQHTRWGTCYSMCTCILRSQEISSRRDPRQTSSYVTTGPNWITRPRLKQPLAERMGLPRLLHRLVRVTCEQGSRHGLKKNRASLKSIGISSC